MMLAEDVDDIATKGEDEWWRCQNISACFFHLHGVEHITAHRFYMPRRAINMPPLPHQPTFSPAPAHMFHNIPHAQFLDRGL